MPEAPVPPTGSSAELAKQRDALGCKPPRRNRTFDWDAQHYWWLECALAKLRPALSRLKPDPALNEEQLTRRMRAARASCPPSDHRDRYTLLPSAVGSKDGTMRVYGGPEALVRGGVLDKPKLQVRRRQHECAHRWFQLPTTALSPTPRAWQSRKWENTGPDSVQEVPVVDLARWVQETFRADDFVVLKRASPRSSNARLSHTAEYKLPPVSLMSAPPSARTVDIEGAEQSVVPALVRSNASQLLDVVLWECHYGGKRKCHVLLSMLKAGGVRRVYQEPNGGFADSWRKTIARQEAQEAKF